MNGSNFIKFLWSIFLQSSDKCWSLQHIANINNGPAWKDWRVTRTRYFVVSHITTFYNWHMGRGERGWWWRGLGQVSYRVDTWQCCRKSKILVRPTDHLWLTVGWSISVLGGPSINNLVRPWNQLKNRPKWANRNPCFLFRHKYKQIYIYIYINGLVQDCSISSGLAMEIL